MYVTPGNSCPPRAPSQVLRAPWLRPGLSAHRPRGGEAAPWHRCGPCTASPAQRGREARLGETRAVCWPGARPVPRGWPGVLASHTHSQRPHAPRPSTEPAAGAQRAEARTPPADSASGLGQRGAGTGRPQAATARKPGTRRRATPPAHGACARAASRATQRSGARNCRAERAGPTHAETLRTAGNAVRSSIS